MTRAFATQALPPWRRAVLKVGSSLLASAQGELSDRNARALAAFVAASRERGREVVIVSSGAVAAGRGRVGNVSRRSDGLVLRQALAALGQTRMIGLWQGLLDVPVAQVLLAHDDLRNRRRYLNARNTLVELLRLGAIPVVNENDTVAVEELKLGDNDNLAATVAALVDAELLLIASDVDGLYSRDPRLGKDAEPVGSVDAITAETYAMAGASRGAVGTGGMRTKLEAAGKAAHAGIATALFNGGDAGVVGNLAEDRVRGTLFRAAGSRLAARKYWLRHAPGSGARLRVDAGAASAIAGGASLLPGGIVGVDGEFARGDIVDVAVSERVIARGLCQYAAGEVCRMAGRRSHEIERLLGFSYGDSVVRRDDLVVTTEEAS